MQRDKLKEKWLTLDEEEKIPNEKQTRDHLAKQSLMKECITDALRKQQGGNCSRSYASLAKVELLKPLLYIPIVITFVKPNHNFRLQVNGVIAAPSLTGCSPNLTIACIPKGSGPD